MVDEKPEYKYGFEVVRGMDPMLKFRINVSSYVLETFGWELTTEQLDYVHGRLWNRYALAGFEWDDVIVCYRSNIIESEVRAIARHARRKWPREY